LRIERINYKGWPNSLRLSNDTVELIVLTDVGPRIISYGFLGDTNQFHEVPSHAGQTGAKEYVAYGGQRLWVSPEVERTYYPDNVACVIQETSEGVRVTAPIEAHPPGTHLQKELEVDLAPAGTHVRVSHRITNQDLQATHLAPWAISMMAPGGRAILPLPPKAPLDMQHLLPVTLFAMWSYTDFSDPRWRLGTKYIELKQESHPAGRFREQMGGIFNPAGWGAYFREGHLFVKRVSVFEGARYPDHGCNFELYSDPDFLELETLGPLVELLPGKWVTHDEEWWLWRMGGQRDVPMGEEDEWIDAAILPRLAKASWGRDGTVTPGAKIVREDPLLSLRSSGQHLWSDEHADDYVRRLREGRE
jgi:hypothetical protein